MGSNESTPHEARVEAEQARLRAISRGSEILKTLASNYRDRISEVSKTGFLIMNVADFDGLNGASQESRGLADEPEKTHPQRLVEMEVSANVLGYLVNVHMSKEPDN